MVAGVPNVKPKAGVETDVAVVGTEETVAAEPDGVLVGVDEMKVGSEAAVDGEVDAESEVEGKSDPVGIGMVPMVLAVSTPTGGVVADPDVVVAPAQSVAETVTVDTTVTVTMLLVPMTTVGVATPFVPEEDVVAKVPALGVTLEMGLETTDDAEVDEDVKS